MKFKTTCPHCGKGIWIEYEVSHIISNFEPLSETGKTI